jgi:protocatechuate 3,4-dioxygenase, alpha subunit
MSLERTPSQTVGPFFEFGLCVRAENEPVATGEPDAVRIEGWVLDGEGAPVPDALVEIWPPWARCGTSADGGFRFVTRRPDALPGQAPHLAVLIFARGLLKPVLTRIYFPDEPANVDDPVLAGMRDDERASVIAVAQKGALLRFDVRLQGARQTAFFSL